MARIDLAVNEIDYLKRALANRYLGLKLWLTRPGSSEPDISLHNSLSIEYDLLSELFLKLDDAKCKYIKGYV